MGVSRINVNGKLTSISLGIDEDEIEMSEYNDEDTIKLDDIIDELKEVINEQNRIN